MVMWFFSILDGIKIIPKVFQAFSSFQLDIPNERLELQCSI